MLRKIGLLFVVLCTLVLAACGPEGDLPDTGTQPVQTAPAGTEDALPDTGADATQPALETPVDSPGDILPPDAALEAQRRISESLNLPVDQVEIVSATQVNWRDSCLELGGPEESCAQVITPGWRIVVRADEKEYEVRTDELGTQVRWMESGQSQ
jgi:hypothetical protein